MILYTQLHASTLNLDNDMEAPIPRANPSELGRHLGPPI